MSDQFEDQDLELDEEIEEAHDPENAEAQSVAATKKAGDATKNCLLYTSPSPRDS